MTHKLTMLSAAVALALASAATQASDFGDKVSIRGFGTLGVMHTNLDGADVVGSVFMPDGAGHTREWDVRSDSRLAAQANVNFTDSLSLTVQAISQYRYDRTFTPNIEWANLKYQFTPNFSARVGRIALPTFLVSDSRLVGYANTWVRPPEEVYQVSSITNSDGADIAYSFTTGSVRNSVQAFYGVSEAKVASSKIEADRIFGTNYLVEKGAAAFRVGYIRMDLEMGEPQMRQLVSGFSFVGDMLNGYGFAVEAAQAHALARKYQLHDLNLSYLSVGASYDPGAWFASAEVIDFGGDGMISDTRGGYVMGGARFGNFTPYAILAKLKDDVQYEPGIDTQGLGMMAAAVQPINDGLNMALKQVQGSQESIALGLRWDGFGNIAVKGQYNYVDLGTGSAGKLGNVQPNFEFGRSYSLFSLTVDFIF